ncbi:MAG: hypothetical protein IKL16_03280 [Clostridia bacterium]|nr:hypothetical protein [Clostridia bacterium]
MKKNQKTSSTKKTAVIILSFLMSLTIIFLTTIVVLHVTLFNDRGLLNKVSETTYFSELNNEIVTRCKTIAVKSGVDYEAIEPVLTSNRVDADFTVYFSSMNGKNPHAGQKTIEIDKLSEELYNSIVKYDSDITNEEKENVRRISALLANEYKETFILDSFEKFIGFSETFKAYSRYVFFILLALFVYLGFVIVSLNGKSQKHRLFRRFAIVGGSVGLTVLSLSLVMKFTGIFEQITFAASQREYNLFMSFFDDFLNLSIIVGTGWLAASIVLIVLWYLHVTGRARD